MDSIKMSPLGRGCGSSHGLDGNIINEQQRTETAGHHGGDQTGQTERGGGGAFDGRVLPAGQADLASVPEAGRRGSGASESGQARTPAQGGKTAPPGAGPLSAVVSRFWPDAGGRETAGGRVGGGS